MKGASAGNGIADGATGSVAPVPLLVEVPGEGYHRGLISCQAACPVHTDARGLRARDRRRPLRGGLPHRARPEPVRVDLRPRLRRALRGRLPPREGAARGRRRSASSRTIARSRFAPSSASPVRSRGPRPGCRRPSSTTSAATSLRCAPTLTRWRRSCAGRSTGAFRAPPARTVAIIGAGPAGLSAAHDLALLGFKPVVFESEPVAAGMLAVGVPAYRLPRELIRREIAVIEALGVEIRCNVTVGKDVSFEELRRTHAAVLVAVGAKSSRALGLPGENGPGVLGGVDLLRAVSLGEPLPLGRDVVVVGGGNVAYDVARIGRPADRVGRGAHGGAPPRDGPRPPRLARGARGDARRHRRDPRGRRGRGRAAERLGAGRDRARRRGRRHGRHVPPLHTRLRREPALLARLRRRRESDAAVRQRSSLRRAGAEPLVPRRRRQGRRARCDRAGRRWTPRRSRRRRPASSSRATSRTARAS